MKESILLAADRRTSLVNTYLAAIDAFKRSKVGMAWGDVILVDWFFSLPQDTKTFKSSVRSLSDKYHGYTEDIASLVKELQPVDSEGAGKVCPTAASF